MNGMPCATNMEALTQAGIVEPVNFSLLWELALDSDGEISLSSVISKLEIAHVPMTPAVRKLGEYLAVLH